MSTHPKDSETESYVERLKEIADGLEKSVGISVNGKLDENRPVAESIREIRSSIRDQELKVTRSLLHSSQSMNRGLVDAVCHADPRYAAARNPPPIRSTSRSLDAVCFALEQVRVRGLKLDKAADWLAKKSDGLIDKKISKSVLTLAKPDYRRNQGKHGKDSPNRKDFDVSALKGHPSWAKYGGLQGFCSVQFSAVLLAAEYELAGGDDRAKYMPQGLNEFLRGLGLYENEVAGYASLIRDERRKAVRAAWGYLKQ